MNKIKKWISWQWFLLRFFWLWRQLDQEGRIEWMREMRYAVWQDRVKKSGKIAPSHNFMIGGRSKRS